MGCPELDRLMPVVLARLGLVSTGPEAATVVDAEGGALPVMEWLVASGSLDSDWGVGVWVRPETKQCGMRCSVIFPLDAWGFSEAAGRLFMAEFNHTAISNNPLIESSWRRTNEGEFVYEAIISIEFYSEEALEMELSVGLSIMKDFQDRHDHYYD